MIEEKEKGASRRTGGSNIIFHLSSAKKVEVETKKIVVLSNRKIRKLFKYIFFSFFRVLRIRKSSCEL